MAKIIKCLISLVLLSLTHGSLADVSYNVNNDEANIKMEKSIFLFSRHQDRSKPNFAEHYINHHAPLGKKLVRILQGYTVNIVEDEKEGEPDALTEHWVPAVRDLLDPMIAHEGNLDDFEKVFADDRTLFAGFKLYVITEEKEIVSGEPLEAPLGTLTQESKIVLMYPDAEGLPPPPPNARRVVDNQVSHRLVHKDGGDWDEVESDIAVFRIVWGAKSDLPDDANRLKLKEYRQIPVPAGWYTK